MKIAFGHQARSGKDEAASYLASKFGDSLILSFSEPVYDIMHYAQRICHFKEEKDRSLLRAIGMWARDRNENTWVDILIEKVNSSQLRHIFVTDVRFPNEYNALKKLGFVMVKIKRDVDDSELRNHESETSLLEYDWDITIENNSTLEDFYRKLDIFRI